MNSNKKSYYETPDVFGREKDDPSRTIATIGRSFSGKTFFVVQELNKLAGKMRDKYRPIYDAIYFMSESLDASPLANLDDRLNVKFIRGYHPKIFQLLKMIQDKSRNSFRFLVILDDIIDEKQIRRGTFVKAMCVLRNSHITTCILCQYPKMIPPAVRNSAHHIYYTGLSSEEWRCQLESHIGAHAREAVGNINSLLQLGCEFKEWVGSDIVHFDQRHDKLNLIYRDPHFNK